MTSISSPTTRMVVGRVDIHGQTHHAAVIDGIGRRLGDREFPASPAGYRPWPLGSAGTAHSRRSASRAPAPTEPRWRVICASSVSVWWRLTGSAGSLAERAASPTRSTPTPPPGQFCRARRRWCRSCAMLASRRSGRCAWPGPARSKPVVRPRTQIKALIVTGPPELREQLRHPRTPKIIAIGARLGPGQQLGDPDHAAKTALRRLARRHQLLSEEIAEADHEIAHLVGEVAPQLVTLLGVGPEVAGQLLTSAGDNPDRTSEAAFAHLCGVAPVPASSGRVHRHRLNRGGDRKANKALYVVVIDRLRWRPTKPRQCRTPHSRGTVQARDHPLLETLRRPGDLQRPRPSSICC